MALHYCKAIIYIHIYLLNKFSSRVAKRGNEILIELCQFDLLSENPKTFMWVSPASQQILDRYNLVQRVCEGNKKVYKDVLIYHKGYKLTKLDKDFITALCDARRKFVK